MSNPVIITAIVEGQTEQIFTREILFPYLCQKEIYITPIIVTKPGQKGVNQATIQKVEELWPKYNPSTRFIPYIAMHEFEALLFSNSTILAQKLNVRKSNVDSILDECGEPENIDDSPQAAPSKRLESLSPQFKKTTTGIAIAKEIGLPTIREKCPIFNEWFTKIERLV